jgi:hypothetical protein
MPQLAKAISSVDLNGNPWVCDCVMFDTVYSWCRNNSVDLGLVCSSPPKFKDKPWTTYENAGCEEDDDDDAYTVFTDLVENMTIIFDKFSLRSHDNYAAQTVPDRITTEIPEQPRTSYNIFLYIYILLFVVVCLLTACGLCYCFRSRKLRRTGPAQSDAEMCHLSSNNT